MICCASRGWSEAIGDGLEEFGGLAFADEAGDEGGDICGEGPKVGEDEDRHGGVEGSNFLREHGRGFGGIEAVIEQYEAEVLVAGDLSAGEANQDRKGFVACLFHEQSIDFKMHRVIVEDENFGMIWMHFGRFPRQL